MPRSDHSASESSSSRYNRVGAVHSSVSRLLERSSFTCSAICSWESYIQGPRTRSSRPMRAILALAGETCRNALPVEKTVEALRPARSSVCHSLGVVRY